MQATLAQAIQERFRSETSQGPVITKRDPDGGKYLSVHFEKQDLALNLRFPPKGHRFALVFTWPVNCPEECQDLFLYKAGKVKSRGFWMDSRFLTCVREKCDTDFLDEVEGPNLDLVLAVLRRSSKDLMEISRTLGWSTEKIELGRSGYYEANPRQVTPAFLRSLPEWGALARVAPISHDEALKVTERFSPILRVVETDGVQEMLELLAAAQHGVQP